MTMQSVADMQRARAALESRSAVELADFILSLAYTSEGISEYVHAFALTGDPKAAADVLRRELEFLKKGERDSAYRYRKGSGHAARAQRMLDAIERCVLPGDPAVAFQLLTMFIDSEVEICEHCWDGHYGASKLFERAWKRIEKLAKALPPAEAVPVLARLRESSHSGGGTRR